MTFYVLSSSTDTRDDYSVGFLIDNSLIGYMIFNMGWVHVRYEVDTTGVRTYIKYGSNEWWRFSLYQLFLIKRGLIKNNKTR